MKVLIPMAGMGKRFLKAGYQVPKILIPIENRPMVEHVARNFSPEDDFVFGINEEHDGGGMMSGVLKRIAPRGVIVPMPYQKEGPTATVQRMLDHVKDEEPVIVNYCDFSWVWDYDSFKRQVAENRCDGAVICYRGFHPHLLGPNHYATLDSDGLWMKEIREKFSWHDDKKKDWSSSGTYYFRQGAFVKKYFTRIQEKKSWLINGEHYVSQVFQLMKEDGLRVFIYEIPFMLQWGTPEDMGQYLYWSGYFHAKKLSDKIFAHPMTVLVLMAGAGKRFVQEGYPAPKPYIAVNGDPMVVQSTRHLPQGDRYLFITRKELQNDAGEKVLKMLFQPATVLCLDELTEGQASTALCAEKLLKPEHPLLIGACDHLIFFDPERFKALTAPDSGVDALIFTYRNNPMVRLNPRMYGWVETDAAGRALRISVKVPLAGDPAQNHAIVGSFWFRKGRYFTENAREMIRENNRINNEFYIDQCMNYLIRNHLRVDVFEVDQYASLGTPDDLRTYEYWQRYFSLKRS